MTSRWFEIPLDVPSAHADSALALLVAAGFQGCEVREGPLGTRLVVYAEAADADEAHGKAATAHAAVAGLVRAESLHDPAGRRAGADARTDSEVAGGLATASPPLVVELDPALWTDNWRRHFSRRCFGGRLEVLPPWEEPSPPTQGLLSLIINPGMAFGTGLHETTAGCLELLIELVRPGDRVADVGCGSGILALAALRLGAQAVRATDIDPLAVEAAIENADRNGLRAGLHVELEDAAARRLSPDELELFDLVVANILAETLVQLREELTGSVRDGGVLVLSGIETSRLCSVLEAFDRPGWSVVRNLENGEWVTVALRRTRCEKTEPEGGTGRQRGPRQAICATSPASQESRDRDRPAGVMCTPTAVAAGGDGVEPGGWGGRDRSTPTGGPCGATAAVGGRGPKTERSAGSEYDWRRDATRQGSVPAADAESSCLAC